MDEITLKAESTWTALGEEFGTDEVKEVDEGAKESDARRAERSSK